MGTNYSSYPKINFVNNDNFKQVYQNSQHAGSFLANLYENQKNNVLCDTTLYVRGPSNVVEFQAHKLVLVSVSEKLRPTLRENSRVNPIERFDIDFEIVKLLFKYAYTGEIAVSKENVASLLFAANYFLITYVEDVCSEFLSERLDPSNCITIWIRADMLLRENLRQKAKQYILAHLDDVHSTREFLDLKYKELEEIYSQDNLDKIEANSLIYPFMCWENDNKDRNGFSLSFMKFLIERQINVDDSTLVKSDSSVIMKYNTRMEINKHLNPDEKCIVALGGQHSIYRYMQAEFYSLLQSNWVEIAPMLKRRVGVGLVSLNRLLYAIGGLESTGKFLSSVEIYNPTLYLWRNLSQSMKFARTEPGATTLGHFIYVAGGYNGSCLDSVEKFDIISQTWSEVAHMQQKRRNCGLIGHDGYVYAIGGYDGLNCLKTVERYDPEREIWQFMEPMQNRRKECSITLLNGQIYVAGGYDNLKFISSAERFDPVTNKWTTIASMLTERSGHQLVECNDLIYALGGYNGWDTLATVEIYDPKTNSWSPGASMIKKRKYFGAVVLGINPKQMRRRPMQIH